MGHTALLRNYDFHAIYKPEQNYDYTSRLVKSCYGLLLRRSMAFHLNKLESSWPKITMCQVWKKLVLLFWRRFLKCHLSVVFAILLLSPLKEMGCLFIWTNLYPLHPKGCLELNLSETGLRLLEKKISKLGQKYFLLFCYYLPLEKDVAFHLNKLESHTPKDTLF